MSKRRTMMAVAIFSSAVLPVFFQACSKEESRVDYSLAPVEEVFTDVDSGRDDDFEPFKDESEKKDLSLETVTSDRRLTLALLKSVFGPKVDESDVSKLGTRISEYGSGCSIYENYLVNSNGTFVSNSPVNACSYSESVNFVKGVVNAPSSSSRSGYLIATCGSLVDKSPTMTYALAQIGKNVPVASDENIRKMVRLFYREKPAPHPALVRSLQGVVGSSATFKGWQAAFYTVCMSGYWQLL